jgi:hypothetical protein
MVVRRAEDASHLFDMSGIVEVDDRVAKVQFEAAAKVRVGGTAGQLLQRVVLQRVQRAESDQTPWKLCDLPAGPVIVAFEFLLGVVNVSRRLLEDVRRGQDDCAFDARRVELLDRSPAVRGLTAATGAVVVTSAASSGLNRC